MNLTLHDLKCGNVLLYNTEDGWMPNVVDWMDLRNLSKYLAPFNAEHRPLPITDEVLRLSGFEFRFGHKYSIHGTTLRFNPFTKEASFFDVLIGRKMTYFHELQNLFYSLRGEMLTLPDEFRNKSFEV